MNKSLLDPRNGEAFDVPAPLDGSKSYVIASVPRSGSTLLARRIWETQLAGRPKEYLNPMQLRDWEVRFGSEMSGWCHAQLSGAAVGALVGRAWSSARLARHLKQVKARRTVGGWFGLKIHYHHFLRCGGNAGMARLLAVDRWVRIRRDDRLGQAISWSRALQSGQWAAWQRPGREPAYSRKSIRQRLAAIEAAEAGWDRVLADRAVHEVSYEALVQDPKATVRGVLEWLDVPNAADAAVPPASMRRQADRETLDWRKRWASGE